MSLRSTLRALSGDKVAAAIEELHRSENDLANSLLTLADEHKVDHEIFYVARDIAGWSQEHAHRLAGAGTAYGLTLAPSPKDRSEIMAGLRHAATEKLGRRHEATVLLIAGLRRVHREAAGVSLDWEVLAQTAQALEDADLLRVAEECHPQTLRQLRWANSKVKELAAQALVAS
jgi:predicted protein tyrosine phosphatase